MRKFNPADSQRDHHHLMLRRPDRNNFLFHRSSSSARASEREGRRKVPDAILKHLCGGSESGRMRKHFFHALVLLSVAASALCLVGVLMWLLFCVCKNRNFSPTPSILTPPLLSLLYVCFIMPVSHTTLKIHSKDKTNFSSFFLLLLSRANGETEA